MDRRVTAFSGRVALEALRGQVEAEAFVAGKAGAVAVPLADLCAGPGGARDRQVVLGAPLVVVERRGGHVFVRMDRDGYCGWLEAGAVGPSLAATHWVAAARGTHLYPDARVQAREVAALPFGARVAVLEEDGKWARVAGGFLPMPHLRRVEAWFEDPVSVAEGFLGTPYLWGGNSGTGIDCSGLVQGAMLACGRDCPGDSDMQARIGVEVTEGDLRRGDLVFWKGHVALMRDAGRIIHANGHSMDVAEEGLAEAIARIAAQGGGPVTARRRV
ncbi:NlpC/P60 family protein [Tabrizicola sp. M-4]|uniref:C40 family peptidase n=1 Tax=Tabrizicola sp. M-4 TaxID=3055847 RepID=UPI003DA96C6C